jgi:hypothetical protein
MRTSNELEIIKKLEASLIYGDKTQIANDCKCSKTDVDRFFDGTKGKYYRKILVAVIKKARQNKEADKLLADAAA